jgi:hypothetical protein
MELVRWSDLGFPKEEGLYHLGGMDLWVDSVRIKQAEEWIASGNDDAVFHELQKGFKRPHSRLMAK